MGLSSFLSRGPCRSFIMLQTEVRAYGTRKNKVPRETLRHIKIKEKQNTTTTLGPYTTYVQVVAAGNRDCGASLCVFSENNRYLFNCGEGTQRLMHENKLKLSRLNNVFVTRMNWANVGGLSGILLTLRDVGLPSCVVSGPPQMENFLQAFNLYCGYLDGIKIEVRPYTAPVYKDETMAVQQVPIFSNGTRNEFLPQSQNPSLSAEAEGQIDGRASSDFQLATADPPCVIAFVCKINDRKGHFLVTKAKEIGLPVGTREIGPLISELKDGKSVIHQGKEIFPEDVLSPTEPGPRFFVVECPTEDFITPMTENETLKRFHEGNPDSGVSLIVHMTPEHILNHRCYRHWMEQFGPGTEHLILNESGSSIHNQSAYKIQTQLNLIHSRIFPRLPELARKEATGKDIRGVQAECLLKYQLRPIIEWQRDMVTSNNTQEFLKEAMNLPGFQEALRESRPVLESELSQAAEVDPQYPEVVFLGTGSAIPMKTRNVSSTLVHVSSSQVLLLDCGEGTFAQLYRHYGGDKVDDILCQLSAVFVSHIHADHHTGLLRVLYERKRALRSRGKPFSPVILVGPTILMTWLKRYHDHCQKNLHNISFISARSLVEGINVDCSKTRSLISSLLEKYQLDKFQTCYVRHCKNAFGCAIVHQSGWKLVFSGDTMPCDALIKMGKDATLLIHEATLEDGLEQDAVEKAHSTTSQAINVGRKMNAGFVMLNHFSQRYSKLPLMSDEFSRKVGISFDHMRIRCSDVQILPKLMEPIKALFAADLIEMGERKEKRLRIQQEAENSAANVIGSADGKRVLEEDTEASTPKRIKST